MVSLNQYCLCEACSTGVGVCELIVEIDCHLEEVTELLSNSTCHTITITDHEELDVACCHAVLLCYYSEVFKRSVHSKAITQVCFEVDNFYVDWKWKTAVQWCYTGRFDEPFDPYTLDFWRSPEAMLEEMWDFAVELEMFELANYCMRLIFQKYSWGFSAGADWWTAVSDHTKCPYEAEGPLYVFHHNREDTSVSKLPSKLFEFIGDLIRTQKPMAAEIKELAGYPEYYEIGWSSVAEDDDMGPWVKSLGGLTDWDARATPPTDRTQWHKYFIPTDSESNKKEWRKSHRLEPFDGKEVLLIARRVPQPDESVNWRWVLEPVI
ncbi:hypothetical protein F4779DRAFT_623108 [Xylariaceae sp. FL0662B]|nr:hypothetical protein F4779DRAFT_623108 [Xylariaceae sp. FL0662B]